MRSLIYQIESEGLDQKYKEIQSFEQMKKEKTLTQWKKVYNFFLENDPRTTYFVLNQVS